MLKGFRDFILRGNVVDLAVAVIIGAAFTQITTALTTQIITPLISAMVGAPDFSNLVFHVPVLHHVSQAAAGAGTTSQTPLPGEIHYGVFLNALINFLLNAAAIYFLIVLPVHKLIQRFKGPEAVTTRPCPQCLSDIPLSATRCKFCTEPVPAMNEITPASH